MLEQFKCQCRPSLLRRAVRINSLSDGKFLFYAFAPMLEITLDLIRSYSDRSSTTVTIDAPLFGVVTVMHGRILIRGTHEADKVGASLGFPPRDQIIAEASRFWIQHSSGVRERKTREEMSRLLREHQRVA